MKRLLLILIAVIPCICMGQIIVPMERQTNGTYLIPCKVNGVPMKFIFDTGASVVNISMTEALFLIKNGFIQDSDIKGTSHAQIANGQIVENTRILLRKIEIGGIELRDVDATVSHNLNAPLLLGQSAIQKLGSIQLDGNRLIIGNNSNSSNRANSYQREPETNIGKSLSIMKRDFPELRYIKTDAKGEEYEDGYPEEGIATFFYFKNGYVIEECMICQSTDDFPLMWYNSMVEAFNKNYRSSLATNTRNHKQYVFSRFKVNLIYVSENGNNTALIQYEK